MEIRLIEKAYRRYAKQYDFYFGALLQPGRKAVIDRLHGRPGERILEVGVGTGLSLPLYPSGVQVTGIDISEEMLVHARTRTAHAGLKQVAALLRMDAENMHFRDDSFDKVVAMYVVSVVPSPTQLLAEMRRVCRPDGALYIVNHFQHANPLVAGVEQLLEPLSRLLGFHPAFPLESFLQDTGLVVSGRIPVNLLGYWTLLHARNNKVPTDSAAPERPASRVRAV